MDKKTAKILATQSFKELERVANVIPSPLYWQNTDGVVLGVNDVACLKIGGPDIQEIRKTVIGKRHEDFYPAHVAKQLNENNRKVIESGQTIEFEEEVENVVTGQIRYFTAVRSPWHDDAGNIIGVIGTSIEITDKKEKERLAFLENERLKFENETQKAIAQEQEKFNKIANQVAHDIRSPIASLLMILRSCQSIPEQQRVALREAATTTNDIANNLLSNYRKKEVNHDQSPTIEECKPILVSAILLQILTDKKYEYQNLAVKFGHHFSQAGNFSWVKIQATAFKRMLSNIINNAVDALGQHEGRISLRLDADDKQVRITIEDNGNGMPPELVQKIMDDVAVTEGKKDGHGIGLTQVRDTLQNNNGKWNIDSNVGTGTKIILTFPRAPAQNWIAETIQLNDTDTVVILDDESSIHMAWNFRFDMILKKFPHITIKHFELGQDTVDFINGLSPDEKQKVFLLTDYELLKQSLNGLDVIEATNIARSILVTSHYANEKVQLLAAKTATKILPKQLAADISINVNQMTVNKNTPIVSNDLKAVDIVFVDDDKNLLTSFTFFASNKEIDTYHNPQQFFDNIHCYPKHTKIMLDYHFDNFSQKGIQIAERLHDMGYSRLYLLSGEDFSEGQIPSYLTNILKTDIERIEGILNE